jgi:hypothetical protein
MNVSNKLTNKIYVCFLTGAMSANTEECKSGGSGGGEAKRFTSAGVDGPEIKTTVASGDPVRYKI